MRTSETRCYIDLNDFKGNRERILARLSDEIAEENGCISAVYKKGNIREMHSRVRLSELAEKIGISREDIEIY